MAIDEDLQRAVDENFEAFQKLLPELMNTRPGKYALMREGEVVEFFDSARDAMIFGQNQYSDGLFSIQQVVDKIVDLGYFSHAVHHSNV